MACGEDDTQSEASPRATADVRETVDPLTGAQGWRVDVRRPGPEYDGEYLVRTFSIDGDLQEERRVSSWRELAPGIDTMAANLLADPAFRQRMEELRQQGLSTPEVVGVLAGDSEKQRGDGER